MKQILFLLLIALCSCHSGFSRKGQGDKTDSVRLQKNYVLYIGMWTALLNLIPSCNNAFIV